MRKDTIIVVAGPTAVGKTRYAIEVAKAFHGEIVSCDSMQLYRYMDIGSAKPTAEERKQVKHYLVDEIDPRTPFSVAEYQGLARKAIDHIFCKGMTPVIAGGTGLYLNSLLYEMDFSQAPSTPELRKQLEAEANTYGALYLHEKLKQLDTAAAERIHPNNVKKVIRAIEGASSGNHIGDFRNCKEKCKNYHPILIGLTRNRQELYGRINDRVDALVEQGLFDEVKDLMSMGLTESDISMKGIGYKEIIGYLQGLYDLPSAIELIKKNTRHLAKRQLTWFRRYEDMHWFNLSEYDTDEIATEEIIKWLKNK
ncbi:MAG: tRNA (adenosine(37)-N6)-dimethylallyltransferase MiaA [Firmicutes bacterium]|nr:tRNA (adenosine(37)-N6)-dimethylallyltransferase MiaA [Bacillota bacterium]